MRKTTILALIALLSIGCGGPASGDADDTRLEHVDALLASSWVLFKRLPELKSASVRVNMKGDRAEISFLDKDGKAIEVFDSEDGPTVDKRDAAAWKGYMVTSRAKLSKEDRSGISHLWKDSRSVGYSPKATLWWQETGREEPAATLHFWSRDRQQTGPLSIAHVGEGMKVDMNYGK